MTKIIIDVREPFEFESGHIDGAINISPVEIMNNSKKLSNISKDSNIILYCRSGSRSNVVAHIMKDMGYTNVVNGINMAQVKNRYS